MTRPLNEELRDIGLDAGLAAIGFASAAPFVAARRRIEANKASGYDAGMQFTYRNPERSTTPSRTLLAANTIVVGAWPYPRPSSSGRTASSSTQPVGSVAAYAYEPYYEHLKGALDKISSRLEEDGYRAKIVVDDNALVDRAAAVRAGIGWIGKNSNVLIPGFGSWVVLGSVITDAHLEVGRVSDRDCGACSKCIHSCPTDAIVAPGIVDGRRCLAWLLQAEGDFPLEFREALGTRIYGCDDCQEVCPPGANVGTVDALSEVSAPDLLNILGSSDDSLLASYGHWYIPKRQPRYLRRNAIVCLGNTNPGPSLRREIEATLSAYLTPGSSGDPMLASHARWALDRLRSTGGEPTVALGTSSR